MNIVLSDLLREEHCALQPQSLLPLMLARDIAGWLGLRLVQVRVIEVQPVRQVSWLSKLYSRVTVIRFTARVR